jgi:hypothetical protein
MMQGELGQQQQQQQQRQVVVVVWADGALSLKHSRQLCCLQPWYIRGFGTTQHPEQCWCQSVSASFTAAFC